jgi:class 3 adenylate cyclase/tetratricopeptide (TPR) repeat protein
MSDGAVADPSEQAARKQVTVLFCDMVDYTSRSISMDPEDLADDIRVFQSICTAVADRYQGNISNYLGDGILVLFGYPCSNEFDAEHALHASLDMIGEIEQNNASRDWHNRKPINIRIGVATSLVVVGEKAGKCRDQDEMIIGEAPNLAARLQTLAKPNTALVSLRTRRLAGGMFKFRDLGERQLKGFPQSVPVWQLLYKSTFQSRKYTSLKRVTTRFVSRDKELSILTDCYEKAVNGRFTYIHLFGEAGIGKSRLVRVFEKSLDKPGMYRIRIRCSPYNGSAPFQPVIDVVNRWVQINSDDDLVHKQSKVLKALSALNISDSASSVLIFDLLGIDQPADLVPLEIGAEEKHHHMLGLLTRILFILSSQQPTILVVEDLHWVDPTTMELLHHIVGNAKSQRLLAIFTFRPGFESTWKNSESLVKIHLDGLDRHESAQLIESVFDHISLPRKIKRTLIKQSDGVPLYLQECSWHVLNQIQGRNGVASMNDDFTVPDTLQDSLNARLDMLGTARELAQLAAAFGAYFTYSNIEKIANRNGIDAEGSMATLLQSGLLKTVLHKNEDRYEFRHVMFQDAAYQSLLKKTRQQYHQQIAEMFLVEDPNINSRHPELIAFHYSKTEYLDIAVDLWIQAARVAISNSAISEAIAHLDRGIHLLKKLSPSHRTKERELQLLLSLAVCLTVRSGYFGNPVTQTYKRCIELANAIGSSEQRWSALYGFWRCVVCMAEFAIALKISVKLNGICNLLDNRKLHMTSLGIRAMTRMFSGRFLSAEKFYQESVIHYDQIEDKNIGLKFGQDPYVTIEGMGAVNGLIRNHKVRSRLRLENSIRVARSIGHPYTIVEALRLAAVYEQISGDLDRLKDLADEAIEISEKFGFEGLLAASNIFLAYSDIVDSRNPRAIPGIIENLDRYREKYALLFYPYFQGLLAESYLYLGRFEEAFTEANQVLYLIDKYGETWVQVPMMHIKTESAVRGKLGSRVEILQWYDDAETLATKQGAALFRNRVIQSRMEFARA